MKHFGQFDRSRLAAATILLAASIGCSDSTNPSTTSNGSNGGSSSTSTSEGGTSGTATTTAAGGANIVTTTGGTAGTSSTSNPLARVDKVDILFMVDNSLAMGDKQLILASAIPQLLGRLTNPLCMDPSGALPSQQMPDPVTACPEGQVREFPPLSDIHLGVISSSLGAFGGDTCPTTGVQNVSQNDHAWLMGALPRNQPALATQFLSWAPGDSQTYATAIGAKSAEFANHINAASEAGCGFEMGLEAWYRFLIDPKPPTDIVKVNQGPNQRGTTDTSILQMRQGFLRPDSLVVVVMLSDENDCSMRDNTYAWAPMTAGSGFCMSRGSSTCTANPNDPCCFSCMLDSLASADCKARDTACTASNAAAKLAMVDDDVNVRCRKMKQRFGYDFLFPPSRYVNALTKTELCPDQTYGDLDCDCSEAKSKGVACIPGTAVPNPLYTNLNPAVAPTGPMRTGADSVFLVGVVGVPWQDLAVDPSDSAPLAYKRAVDLEWNLFAPRVDEDYSQAQLGDPLMIESMVPRTGTHPITKQAVAPPEAARLANRINGHEWNTSNKDVQFACVFSLDAQLTSNSASAVHTCDLATECGADDGSDAYKICARRYDACSCTLSAATATTKSLLDPTVSLSPLCQDNQNGYGNKQYFAKAYPGLRQLQVLRGFYERNPSDNAVVGSICPKDLAYTNRMSDGYGYNPVMTSLANALGKRL